MQVQIFSIVLLVLFSLVVQTNGHFECVHDKIPAPTVQAAHQNYQKLDGTQRRAEATTAPIRIHFHTSEIEKSLPSAKMSYVKKLLVEIGELAGDALSVVPVEGNLHVSRTCLAVWTSGPGEGDCAEVSTKPAQCGTMTAIPEEHMGSVKLRNGDGSTRSIASGTGIPNADLVVYVTGDDSEAICKNSQALAFAHACQRDQRDRPIAGYIHFCANHLPSDTGQEPEREHVMLALHELTHILGMSTQSFSLFRDEAGAPRTARCPEDPDCQAHDAPGSPPLVSGGRFKVASSTMEVLEKRGKKITRLVTPAVKEVAQKHFGCSTLHGAELEDDGGDGTALSHWEKRLFVSEYMTGSQGGGGDEVLSLFTLALLQDSGWYVVNFDAAGEFKYGRAQGCAFPADECPTIRDIGQCDQAQTSRPRCTFDHSAIGYCGAQDPLMDGCPFVYPQQKCNKDSGSTLNWCGSDDCTGGTWGPETACFETSLGKVGWEVPYGQTVACYEHRCKEKAEGKYVEVRTPDGVWHACDGSQAVLQSAGYTGGVICPPPNTLCGSSIEPPAVQQLTPLDPDDYKDKSGPTSVFKGISVRQWAIFIGIGVGGLIGIYIITYIVRWRKRSTNSLRASALSAVARIRTPLSRTSHPSTPARTQPPTPAPVYSSALPPIQHPPELPPRSELPPLPPRPPAQSQGPSRPGHPPPNIPLPPDLNPAEWGGLTAFRALNPHSLPHSLDSTGARDPPHRAVHLETVQHAAPRSPPPRPDHPPPPRPRSRSPPPLNHLRGPPVLGQSQPPEVDLPPGVWEAIAGAGGSVRPASMDVADTLSVDSVEVEGSMAGVRAHCAAGRVLSEQGSFRSERTAELRSEDWDGDGLGYGLWESRHEPSAPSAVATVAQAQEMVSAQRAMLVPDLEVGRMPPIDRC